MPVSHAETRKRVYQTRIYHQAGILSSILHKTFNERIKHDLRPGCSAAWQQQTCYTPEHHYHHY